MHQLSPIGEARPVHGGVRHTRDRQIRFVDKEKRLRANILDPGLTGAGGHHLEYDLRVARELMCRGI